MDSPRFSTTADFSVFSPTYLLFEPHYQRFTYAALTRAAFLLFQINALVIILSVIIYDSKSSNQDACKYRFNLRYLNISIS